ncbi:MAG: acetylornithine/succinylornithine family transaminase [Ruminococcaceae bacterium]|nr:acetylornithine/succinylornithine family transaminase [Oscillospiraceae bacterium]
MNIKEKDNLYIANTYARFPLVLKEGKGSAVWDEDGKEYIDLGTGIAVNTFGFSDSEWVNAVTKQLNTLQHTSNLYFSEPCADLAEMLCSRTGMKKVFFSNSGAEANECAIKVARKYAAEKKGAEYNTIITLKNSFHGRTITTLAATGQDVFHKDFLPLTDGFIYCEANNCEELKRLVETNKIAAIMFETVQGEGGVLPLTDEFVKTIFEIAKANDILTIADEVQTGNGRTGKLYGYMNYGVKPDIFSTAKGLGGGLPLGATVLGEKVENVLNPGSHGSTFGGNPVACAGAVNILSRITDELLNEVAEKSQYIVEKLSNAKGVKSVSGKGFMLGIETEKDAGSVIAECQKNGVLVIKAKNKVRLLPALNIPMELLEKAIDVIIEACKEN